MNTFSFGMQTIPNKENGRAVRRCFILMLIATGSLLSWEQRSRVLALRAQAKFSAGIVFAVKGHNGTHVIEMLSYLNTSVLPKVHGSYKCNIKLIKKITIGIFHEFCAKILPVHGFQFQKVLPQNQLIF